VISAHHSPLFDASRLQMLVTLARRRLKSGYLDIHPQASEDITIRELCSGSPGIAAVRLTAGIRIGDYEIGRRKVLEGAIEKMNSTDAGDFEKVVRGRSLDLICVSGSKIQFLRPLFSAKGVVKEHKAMRSTMNTLNECINKQSQFKVPTSLINALGVFSSELIKNTQDHALSDHTGKPYIAHVEGMLLGWTRIDEELYLDDFSGNDRLKEYWKNESGKTDNEVRSLRVFQISYFDSGPGFVSRMTNRLPESMTLEEERDYLIKCLRHNSTSKSQDAAGEGLPTVLEELKKIGGLIRIRSGRLSVFNAFSKDCLNQDIFDFQDWSERNLAAVEGAVISILVPLRGN
jgi:hypothetical protein